MDVPAPSRMNALSRNEPELGFELGNRYRLERLIGRGGSAAVYQGVDTMLDQPVAIKVLLSGSINFTAGAVEQGIDLRNEAIAAMKLSHPHILRVYNYECDGPWQYLVMEYVPGEDSHRVSMRQAGGYLSAKQTLRIAAECLDALGHAHDLGVHHHDLKPSNLLLTRAGSTKICDFGLARLISLHRGGPSSSGSVAGSPPFISPERIRGGDGDHRSDLYALAATLYALGNGRWLFTGDQPAILRGHLYGPVPASNVLPPAIHEVLAIALAKEPSRRFQSAHDMADAVREAREALQAIRSTASARAPVRSVSPSTLRWCPRARTLVSKSVVEDDFTTSSTTNSTTSSTSPPAAPMSEVILPQEMALIEEMSFTSAHGDTLVVPDFLLDVTPVTNREYLAFVRDAGALPPLDWGDMEPPEEILELPVVGIDHAAAAAFALWCGKRLPTPAQWEAAARRPDGRAFPWGDEMMGELCNVRGSGPGTLTPVTHYEDGRSVDGCYDLVGNVWEWTAEQKGERAPEEGYAWVYGGSYKHRAAHRGAIARNSVLMLSEYPYVGFRCAKDV